MEKKRLKSCKGVSKMTNRTKIIIAILIIAAIIVTIFGIISINSTKNRKNREQDEIDNMMEYFEENVEKENNYEFTFRYANNIVEDNIESIFANTMLIAIKKTDKQGLEQVQDSIR